MWHAPCKRVGMKNLLLSSISACLLFTLIGCSDSGQQTTASTSQSASMQTDSKDMQTHH
jgi:hypothetical protein